MNDKDTQDQAMLDQPAADQPMISHFRQAVFWPVQLISPDAGQQIHSHWEHLAAAAGNTPWQEIEDEFISAEHFSDRRYREFVTFLPYAQRFLYGEGIRGDGDPNIGRSPVRVFYRSDIVSVRIKFDTHPEPLVFKVDQVSLYFFYDIDVAILVVELAGKDIPLDRAMETLFRFGRAYPSHWEASGRGGHCAEKVEWLNARDEVLAISDYEQKERYLEFVREHRVPRVASHWEYLLQPMVQHYSDQEGPIRYREIEYQRMPLMSYLAFDDISRLTRGDLVRLGLVTRPGDSESLPFSASFLQNFENHYCYDRYWGEKSEHGSGQTRFICNGQNFAVIGCADDPSFTNKETGVISQFRHQYQLLFLIAHFQKASLLMLADRLVLAISHLDIDDPISVRVFRKKVRYTLEIFLRFTQRYWFHAVSDQAQSRDLFTMMLRHLDTNDLFEKTRRRILDMTEYLDSDQLKQQAETVVRLTVVTILGLIGTIVTGMLGVNLIAAADSPLSTKLLYIALTFVPVTVLTFYTVVKSNRLSVFLDALSNEGLSKRDKLKVFIDVWAKKLPL